MPTPWTTEPRMRSRSRYAMSAAQCPAQLGPPSSAPHDDAGRVDLAARAQVVERAREHALRADIDLERRLIVGRITKAVRKLACSRRAGSHTKSGCDGRQ